MKQIRAWLPVLVSPWAPPTRFWGLTILDAAWVVCVALTGSELQGCSLTFNIREEPCLCGVQLRLTLVQNSLLDELGRQAPSASPTTPTASATDATTAVAAHSNTRTVIGASGLVQQPPAAMATSAEGLAQEAHGEQVRHAKSEMGPHSSGQASPAQAAPAAGAASTSTQMELSVAAVGPPPAPTNEVDGSRPSAALLAAVGQTAHSSGARSSRGITLRIACAAKCNAGSVCAF